MKLMSVALSESDIPGSSLYGGNPSQLKNDELRFWLKYRDDPATGLRTKAEFLKWPNTVLARALLMQISTCTRISKNKHAVNRAMILFTQHSHYLCYFSL